MDASGLLPEVQFAAASTPEKRKSCSISSSKGGSSSDLSEVAYDPREEFAKFLEEARMHENDIKIMENSETMELRVLNKIDEEIMHADDIKNTDISETMELGVLNKIDEEKNVSWWKKIFQQFWGKANNINDNHDINNNNGEAHQNGGRSRSHHFERQCSLASTDVRQAGAAGGFSDPTTKSGPIF